MVKLPILVEIVAQDPSIPDIDAAAEASVEEAAAFSLFGLPLWASILIIAAAAALLIALAIGLTVRAVRRKKRRNDPVRDEITIGKLHEQGAREGQQDSFGVSDETLTPTHGFLAAVADGMGGLTDGDKVSAAAVETVLDGFMMYQGKGEPKALLLSLAAEATRSVNALLGPENYRKSGSTMVLGLVKDGNFTFLSIGDSRVCLYRGGELMQLNREHTYESELAVRAVNGELGVADALSDPKGAGLVSFLGMGEIKAIDLPAAPLRLLPGDKLILMSDGVYNALEDSELAEALNASPEDAAERLREAIKGKNYSNQDNYTAIIIEYGAEE